MSFGASPSSKWHATASFTMDCSSSSESAAVKIECPRALAEKPPPGASSTRNMISLVAGLAPCYTANRRKRQKYLAATKSWRPAMEWLTHMRWAGPGRPMQNDQSSRGELWKRFRSGMRVCGDEPLWSGGWIEWAGEGARRGSGGPPSGGSNLRIRLLFRANGLRARFG